MLLTVAIPFAFLVGKVSIIFLLYRLLVIYTYTSLLRGRILLQSNYSPADCMGRAIPVYSTRKLNPTPKIKIFIWYDFISCTTGYISTSINDGPGCLTLRCPDPSCGAAIGQDMVNNLSSADDKDKYNRYFLRSFVEDNRKVVSWLKWTFFFYSLIKAMTVSLSNQN